MSCKYEKFEKLSDAVRAWESGETVYFKNIDSEYKPKDSEDEDFFSYSKYYRRIEVKPFECWGIFWENGGFVGVVECENSPKVLSGQRAARLREVIE